MIQLKKQGDRAPIDLTKSSSGGPQTKIHVTLRWRAAVDLDLHAFALTRDGRLVHVFFASKGRADLQPFITLDQDAGVGNTAGDNEENLVVHNLLPYAKIVFCANIFRFFGFLSKGDNFGKYDGSVRVQALGQTLDVPLTSTDIGKWATVAAIDNDPPGAHVRNINRILANQPTLDLLKSL